MDTLIQAIKEAGWVLTIVFVVQVTAGIALIVLVIWGHFNGIHFRLFHWYIEDDDRLSYSNPRRKPHHLVYFNHRRYRHHI